MMILKLGMEIAENYKGKVFLMAIDLNSQYEGG